MATMEILTTGQQVEWTAILQRCAPFDFYHTPQYHALAEDAGEGTARLFVYREGDCVIALPLLLRPLDGLAGVSPVGESCWDATSVYGYAGPICVPSEPPESVIRGFQSALQEQLRALQIVTVFSRLHPIIPQHSLLRGLGECHAYNRTVSIDLTLPVETQRAAFRKNHKEGINKLRRARVTCVHAEGDLLLDEFLDIYDETMRRVGAQESYFFPRAYFERLASDLPGQVNRFICLHQGRAICGGVFVECCGMLQYHLGGTLDDSLKLAPMKLLVEDVRLWANRRGLQIFHIGGGTTSRMDDPLLHFKLGFSSRVHEFAVWRWVLSPAIYQELCAAKSQWNGQHALCITQTAFFPQYRAPTAPAELVALGNGSAETTPGNVEVSS